MRRNLDDEVVKGSTGVFASDLEDQVATWTRLESEAFAFDQDLGLARGDHPAPPRVLAIPGSRPGNFRLIASYLISSYLSRAT